MLYGILATLIYVSSFELPFFSPGTSPLAVTFGFPMLPPFPLLLLLLFLLLLLLLLLLLIFLFRHSPSRPFPSLESSWAESSEHAPRAFHLAIEAIVDSSAQSNLDFFSKVNYSAGLCPARGSGQQEPGCGPDESANLRALS